MRGVPGCFLPVTPGTICPPLLWLLEAICAVGSRPRPVSGFASGSCLCRLAPTLQPLVRSPCDCVRHVPGMVSAPRDNELKCLLKSLCHRRQHGPGFWDPRVDSSGAWSSPLHLGSPGHHGATDSCWRTSLKATVFQSTSHQQIPGARLRWGTWQEPSLRGCGPDTQTTILLQRPWAKSHTWTTVALAQEAPSVSSVHRWGWGRPWTLPLLGGRSNPSLASLPDPVRIFSRAPESRERTPRRWAGLDPLPPRPASPSRGGSIPVWLCL